MYKGLYLSGVNDESGVKKNNDEYADDVDTWIRDDGEIRDAVNAIIVQFNEGAHKWSNFQVVIATSIVFTNSW